MLICQTPVNKTETEHSSTQLEELLALIAVSDQEALAKLYHITCASVFAFALSVLKNTQDAEDVLQECYLSIYSSAAAYRPMGKPLAWILTITRNLCLLKLRERRRFADISPEAWEDSLQSCGNLSPEDRIILNQCMNRLSDKERQVIILHAVAGFKHREIAELLELPLPNVLSKYNRALKKLKKHLEKENEYHDK